MTRSLFKILLASFAFAAVSTGAVTAAPVLSSAPGVATAHSLVQPVYWVHRHGHRVWVPEHRHHR